ncbi:Sodium-coupled monocarboxylate transporter 1 [Bagarius yarrelli]|uniref:Sodium-coupled monocarboxylate transporter 1 n=1 Tax=Bagarius yarrelli TaxID=175774 RepID=A0A556THA9_BAGYA|nr:Sodium-coupled monocarboxylate transporter 1 [Bagarius yarrelli]
MEIKEDPAASFSIWDYVVFALMLIISAAIGVYYAFTQRRDQSTRDFLVGGRSMTAIPIALSLTASFMSAITVLATPVEVYCNGAMFVLISFGFVLMAAISSEVFIPIFYRLGKPSTFELMYTGVVIYAPALALNHGMNLWGALISTGMVCTFYCALGGLKAVVWTDVFQVIIMLAGFLAVIVQSVLLQGGVSVIFNDSVQGGRLNLWDFDPNPLRRHTFWTIIIGSTFIWSSIYGINQAQVQRYVSCRTLLQAKITVSSSVNALAAVTILDLIDPYFNFSERQLSWASKGLSVFYGVACIGLAGLVSMMGGLLQTAVSVMGALNGPLLGLFSLGILFPSTNSKGGLAGLVSGLVVSLWVCIGAQIYQPLEGNARPLPLQTHGCNFTTEKHHLLNWTSYPTQSSFITSTGQHKAVDRPLLADYWYSVSYMYYCPMGTLVCVVIGVFVSLLSGGRRLKVEAGLTLMKEDLTCYKIYKILKQKVTGNADRLDLVAEKEKSGRSNLAFCDVELDITKVQTHKIFA